jgi:uncharacterized YigZ family protein
LKAKKDMDSAEQPFEIRTIAVDSEGLYREKGSKFLGFAYPAHAMEEIKHHLDILRQDHPKARHHCYAYRLGSGVPTEFSSDAGEPSGSAGLPILNVMRSSDLTDALIVVVRYYGGTKLGIPGLINAYKQAASDALAHNRIVTKPLTVWYKVSTSYENMDRVYKLVSRVNGKIAAQEIGTVSVFQLEIPVQTEQTFLASLPDGMEYSKIRE